MFFEWNGTQAKVRDPEAKLPPQAPQEEVRREQRPAGKVER